MDIKAAQNDVRNMYKDLKPIVDDVVVKHSSSIDMIIKKIKDNLNNLTNKEIREYIMQLSIEAYYFAQDKDMSLLMQECSTAILKVKNADEFNAATGTQSSKSNEAIINSQPQMVTNMVYSAISNRMKSKLDETHRVINMLSSILISNNAEAKLKGVERENDLYSNSDPNNQTGPPNEPT